MIVQKYPGLATVVDRLLDIYFLLSAGMHGCTDDEQSEADSDVGKFIAREGRLISTRDLMKWCSRIATNFDVSDAETGTKVFLEALDCFATSLDRDDKFLALSEAIGAKLNITKAKVRAHNISNMDLITLITLILSVVSF